MKKFLLSLATVLCAGAFASAADVTYSHTFASGELKTTAGDVTLSDVSWTSTAPTYVGWDSAKGIQLGSKNKPTNSYSLSTSGFAENTIKSITVNSSIASGGDATLTVSVGGTNVINAEKLTTTATDYSAKNLNVTGDVAISWTCTVKAFYIKSISITYATAQGVVVVTAPTFSPAGGKYTEAQTVSLTSEGNTIYYTIDGADPTDDTADGSTIKYTDPIIVDKTTTIKAIAFDANDNKSGIVSQTYTIVETYPGAEGDGTEANPYNAAGAYNAALLGSTANVYVKGTIVSIPEMSPTATTTYGNASYYISADGTATNQFYIFRGFGLNGEKFATGDEIKVGDVVVVSGKLSSYKDVPQLAQGSKIVSINGEEPEPIVLEGDGTEAKPFTVADVRAINPTSTTENPDYPEKYWVKGYIVGRCDGKSYAPVFSATAVDDATAIGATNIVIAPTPDCTNANLCIPVALPTGNVREKLNLKDNPTNLRQAVEVYGNIYAYFNQPGVKNTSDYKLASDGVEGIEIDENAPVEYFNLQGVRVENPANGLYIMRQGDKVVKVIK